jgi:AhpD family alkylhydroperoxidase
VNERFIKTARRSSLAQVRHVAPVRPGAATGLVARVYDQVERDFGMLAPPIALHSPAPGPLAASWLMLRETLLTTGLVDRAAKEAVGAAVSLGNTCPYCVEVHSATLGGLTPGGDAAAIAAGRIESIADPAVREIASWARACGGKDATERAPFPARRAPELVGTVVAFHYLNRMVNVFLRESPFPPSLPAAARGGLLRLLVKVLGRTTREVRPSGSSLSLLPAAPLPADLSWAAGDPHVGGAFARAAAAVDEGGSRSVPTAVRDLVTVRLAAWDGNPPGLGRAWADDAVSGLPVAERPAGRLALLTALASYQVDRPDIDAFRRGGHDDRALIELTSWASFAAARQMGAWIPAPAARQSQESSRASSRAS